MARLGEKKRTFTPAEDEYITDWRGRKSSAEIGADIGRSEDAVRRRWRVLGLTNTLPRHYGPSGAQKPRRPAAADTSNDRALITQYLAANDVTLLEPGTAAGLSRIEQQLYAAPVGGDWRERMANRLKGRARK